MKNQSNRFKKIMSLILSVVMVLSMSPLSVFAETITLGSWTITNNDTTSGSATFGDIGFKYYSPTTIIASGSSGGKDYVKSNNTNGKATNGIVDTTGSYADFTPSVDGTLTVFVGNASTKTGYVSKKNNETNETSAVGNFVPGGNPVSVTGFEVVQGTSWATVNVEVSKGFTYYVTLSGSKMLCYGAEFTPYTQINGTVTDSTGTFTATDYDIRFTNKTTNEAFLAQVSNGQYQTYLKPNYDYSISLTGSDATNYGFSGSTRNISVTPNTVLEHNLVIEETISYIVSGQINGFDLNYGASDMKLTFVPDDTLSYEKIKAEVDMVDTSNRTYSANLIAGQNYTLELDGAYDYELANDVSVNHTSSSAVTVDVQVKKVPTYSVSGKFLGLTQVRGEYETLDVTPTAISFKNVDDKYTYDGSTSNGRYSVDLRDGSYLATIDSADYSTTTHVVVNNGTVSRDLLLKDLRAKTVEYKDTVYVGSDKEYKSISSAVADITKMTRTNGERVVIKVDPGVYREQVVVNTPNITIESNGGTKEDTKISWYYGIGYKYYSCVNSYYDAYADYDKFNKGDVVSYWGSAVITNKDAKGFRAKDITFENSFNKYMTDEEIVDGAEPNGLQAINVARKENTNVDTKASTERAAAYVNYADQTEFLNCSFIGSQDTLYTSNIATDAYYKNCYIEGQTDFIYGNGDVIFDGCEINFCGYDGTAAVGYLTAQSSSTQYLAQDGYIFRSCIVTYDDERMVTPGYLGRMWGDSAKVAFLNTALEDKDMLVKEGWVAMGSVLPTSPAVTLKEYNTSFNGTATDLSGRVNGAVTSINNEDYSVEKVFIEKGYTPYYYSTDAKTNPEFATLPTFISNGDLNTPNPGETLTVSYSLGNDWVSGDASRISWYAVSEGYDNTSLSTILQSATLLKTTSVVSTNKFQIPMECAGKYIMAVVTPMTNYGLSSESKYIIDTQKTVSNTWSDPDNEGSIAPGSGTTIFLAGDSTVKDYSINGIYNGGSIIKEGSWGEFLKYFLDDDFVTVNNYAQGGRSSRSFINEGKLTNITNNIKAGDYLFIQFGHNDCANGSAYAEERFVPLYTEANPKTDAGYPTILPVESMKVDTPAAYKNTYGDKYYAWNSGATYKGYIQQYINVALEKGAIPVIVSPVTRVYYNADGTIKPHHDANMTDYAPTLNLQTTNNAYVTACEELYAANKDKGVLYLDGFGITKDLFEQAYKDGGSDVNGMALMSVGDKTHNNKTGGVIESGLIANWIKNANLNISKYVIQPTTVYGEMPDGQNIFTIKNKVFTAKDSTYTQSAYWTTYGQKLFDSLALPIETIKQDQPAPSQFTLTFTDNGNSTFTATIPQVTNGEYSFDGVNFTSSNTKTDCLPNTQYTGYVRFKATDVYNVSPITSDTKTSPTVDPTKQDQPAPSQFTLTFTDNGNSTFTATIPQVTNGEYSFDGVNFTSSNTKADCLPNTSYTGYVRFKATDVYNVSPTTSDTKTTPKVETVVTKYTVRLSVSNGGTISGSGDYEAGETVTITATPNSNYTFSSWSTIDDVTFADANSATTTFVMPSKDVAIKASFKAKETTSNNNNSGSSNGGNSVTKKPITSTPSEKPVVTENPTTNKPSAELNNVVEAKNEVKTSADNTKKVVYDVSTLDLSDEDKENLVIVMVDEVTGEVTYLGGRFDEETNTLETNLKLEDGNYKLVVADPNDYNQVELQIGNNDVSLNGNNGRLEAAPMIIENTTYVPIRVVSEGLGANVSYEPNTKTAIIEMNGKVVEFSTNKELADSQKPIIVNNRMLIPVRFVSESLGANVNWFADDKSIQITKGK